MPRVPDQHIYKLCLLIWQRQRGLSVIAVLYSLISALYHSFRWRVRSFSKENLGLCIRGPLETEATTSRNETYRPVAGSKRIFAIPRSSCPLCWSCSLCGSLGSRQLPSRSPEQGWTPPPTSWATLNLWFHTSSTQCFIKILKKIASSFLIWEN